ncbi:EthD domain-containing protein [Novosphingobium sp. G106]|uniref:EthD domain-containing protein n=1 Tax=Novosphingobium sp. G106 TaxID=2849500 RepID=UPI001C2D6D88|nr:EthD domain-containing protein [Novosphingobium sp. G106]MBV1688932.1 EthD domain-containing protein [Novosphingobium sp. G106]
MPDDVVKVIYLARRNPAMSAGEFPDRWRQHAILGGTLPSLRGSFVQVAQCLNIYDRKIVGRASLDYDGVNLLTVIDRSAALRLNQDPAVFDIMLPDELQTFSTYVRHFSLQCREQVLRAGPMLGHCLITFLRRARNVAPDVFERQLTTHLGAMVSTANRTVFNRVEDRMPGYDFDAITESWFASAEEAASATKSPEYKDHLRSREIVCDEGFSIVMMTRLNHSWPALAEST